MWQLCPVFIGYSIAMPDIHHGYGFPIGGVAAFDAQHGVISPGGVGYDINCGVRLVRTDLSFADIRRPVCRKLSMPSFSMFLGSRLGSRVRVSKTEIDQVLTQGARWAVDREYGWQQDLTVQEENGGIDGADPSLGQRQRQETRWPSARKPWRRQSFSRGPES